MVKIIIVAVLAVILLIVAWLIATYNNLVRLRNKVKDQWSQVDVQLKRRFDLIPNIVETVKGYAKHEKETFEAVVKARNTALSASSKEAEIKADGELSGALNKEALVECMEHHPQKILDKTIGYDELVKTIKEVLDTPVEE